MCLAFLWDHNGGFGSEDGADLTVATVSKGAQLTSREIGPDLGWVLKGEH